MSDLRARLRALGLLAASSAIDDLVALATKKRWGAPDNTEGFVLRFVSAERDFGWLGVPGQRIGRGRSSMGCK